MYLRTPLMEHCRCNTARPDERPAFWPASCFAQRPVGIYLGVKYRRWGSGGDPVRVASTSGGESLSVSFHVPFDEVRPVELIGANCSVECGPRIPNGPGGLTAGILLDALYSADDMSVRSLKRNLTLLLGGSSVPSSGVRLEIDSATYVMVPCEAPNPSLLQVELTMKWVSLDDALEQIHDSRLASLDLVRAKRAFDFSVHDAFSPPRPIRSVVSANAQVEHTAVAAGPTAALVGSVRVVLVLEGADGALIRQSRSVAFRQAEPLSSHPRGTLHALPDEARVSVRLAGANLLEMTVRVAGLIVETQAKTVAVRCPPAGRAAANSIRLMASLSRPLVENRSTLAERIVLDGAPSGPLLCSLEAGPLQHLGHSVAQEVRGDCDLYYVNPNGEEERRLVNLEDLFVEPVEVPAERLTSQVFVEGEPGIVPDGNGGYLLSVPVVHQVFENQKGVITVLESTDVNGSFEALVQEAVASAPLNVLVPLAAGTPIVPGPHVAATCRIEAETCHLEGELSWDAFVTGTAEVEQMVPVRVTFSDSIPLAGALPADEAVCELIAYPVPSDRPAVLVEGRIVALRTRIARLDPGPWNTTDRRDVSLECHLFWQSAKPPAARGDPFRVETRPAALNWRSRDGILQIDGFIDRLLYFTGPDGRLYCTTGRIPFATAAPVGAPAERIAVRVSDIKPRVETMKHAGLPTHVEEEYQVSLLIARDSPRES